MKRRILSLVLAAVLLMALLPVPTQAATQSGTWGDNITWTFDEATKTLTISGTGPMKGSGYNPDLGKYESPGWCDLPVKTVIVGEGITSLSGVAFYDMDIHEISLPSTLEYIGAFAISNCPNLKELTLPASLKEIELNEWTPFSGCTGLEAIYVDTENRVYASDSQGALYTKDMGTLVFLPYAFEGIFTLPATVHTIGLQEYFEADIGSIFSDCLKLTAFNVAEGNEIFWAEQGLLCYRTWYSDSLLMSCPPAYDVSNELHIPANVEDLGQGALWNCHILTDIYFGANTEFDGYDITCPNLLNIWVEDGHPDYVSVDGVLFNNSTQHWSIGDDEVDFQPMEILELLPAGRTGYYEIPEGVRYCNDDTSADHKINALRFPSTLKYTPSLNQGYPNLNWVMFTGEKPQDGNFIGFFHPVDITIYYPDWLESWSDPTIHMTWTEGWYPETRITYVSYSQGNEPVWGEETEPENPFTDVPAGKWYTEPVLWAVEREITNGMGDGTFGIETVCNRAQVVTFLWRAAGCPKPTATSCPFTDVKLGKWYSDAVLWAVEQGITNGITATEFGLENPCNRATVVTFLWRAKGKPTPASSDCPFTDVQAGKWYSDAILWAVENDITNGISATEFGLENLCNRATVVTFLYRTFAK